MMMQDYIEANSIPEPNTGCWIWLGSEHGTGYGTLSIGGKNRLAHRVSYETFLGDIPNGLHIDHICENRFCVNPGHLEPVTCEENISRQSKRRKICKFGHPLTEDNLYFVSTRPTVRRCLICQRRHWKEGSMRARKRAKHA
jgi:hypothetical protein